MKIACFLQGKTTPSSRFRIGQYLDYFREAGIEPTCFYPIIPKYGYAPSWLRGKPLRTFAMRLTQLFIYVPHRWWQIRRARLGGYDVVVIQKQLTLWPVGAYLEKMIAKRNSRVILDLDDAEFTTPTNPQAPKCNDPILDAAALARVVVVCNKYLESLVTPATRKCVKLPTTVDEFNFVPARRGFRDEVVIGWTGSASTVGYLRLVLPALEVVLARCHASLLIISNQPHISWLSHLPRVRFLKWNPEDEVSQLQQIDIGIMPLPDDLWTRGKCAFKIIQYMAVGIPTVASPVGMNCEVIQDTVTGYFSRTTEEWIDRLESLIQSHMHRQEMGDAARRYFEERLSGSTVAAEWVKLLHAVGESSE